MYIKELLEEGEVELAGKLLGYPYSVSGIVRHGKRLGRTLGFPTLNVQWPKESRPCQEACMPAKVWWTAYGMKVFLMLG